eukprot:5893107-Amphidinium_carterae.2
MARKLSHRFVFHVAWLACACHERQELKRKLNADLHVVCVTSAPACTQQASTGRRGAGLSIFAVMELGQRRSFPSRH